MISKKVISFFTFGVFLIIAGVILKFTKNPQSNLVMAIGLVFELFAALLFIWNKLKK
ncbi:hypothetical protein MKD41_02180 [Lutibacter sp. A64]|uniref:hypothetical protein n=1 Tax=Lutibacter sp. A64 TaxID=2918526 RepID=UPI001F059F80|nr:hypothetical protein [Lutibacter sp. A64]UMB54298.1 hypothetical protein MKD41_02180 [Lutibacter sp. A64]